MKTHHYPRPGGFYADPPAGYDGVTPVAPAPLELRHATIAGYYCRILAIVGAHAAKNT